MGRSEVKIAASVLAADFARLGQQISEAEEGGADYIHVDVMDGCFVPNITIGPVVVRAIRQSTHLPLDVHLMIEAPERYLAEFAAAGADILTVQVETCPHLHRTVQQIKELGCRAGIALNPATPAVALEEMIPFADLVLAMTVNPGFGGQTLIQEVLAKVQRLRDMLARFGSKAELEVDGGIGPGTAPMVFQAGANVLVAGTAIFRAPEGIREAISRIRQAV